MLVGLAPVEMMMALPVGYIRLIYCVPRNAALADDRLHAAFVHRVVN